MLTINQQNISGFQVQSNNTYFVEDCTGSINLNNVSDVTLCSPIGKSVLKGAIELTGHCNNINIINLEIHGGNICIQVRSYGDNINVINCTLHDAQYAIWLRANNGDGFNSNFTVTGCEIYNTLDDGIYGYKIHRPVIRHNHIHHVNMNWKPPSTSQKIAAGDGIQLIFIDNPVIEFNRIDRSATGNKFCLIISGTNDVHPNQWQISNNEFLLPIATSEGGAGIYIYDLKPSTVVEFAFNQVAGSMCAIKFNSYGTFYSTGNDYYTTFGIELQRSSAKGQSIDDFFAMPDNKRVTNNVELTQN